MRRQIRGSLKMHTYGMTEDEMVGWHHRHNGHGFGWTPGVGDGQGGLATAVHEVAKSQTWLSDWTELTKNVWNNFEMVCDEMSTVYLRVSQSYTLNYLHTEAAQIITIFFPWVCFGKKGYRRKVNSEGSLNKRKVFTHKRCRRNYKSNTKEPVAWKKFSDLNLLASL